MAGPSAGDGGRKEGKPHPDSQGQGGGRTEGLTPRGGGREFEGHSLHSFAT